MLHIIPRREAFRLGMKRFFTGLLCKRSHDSERLTSSGTCVACSNARTAKFRAENAEEMRRRYREYHSKNRAERNERSRSYRRENPEKWRAIDRASKAARKEQISAYMALYRATMREAISAMNAAYRQINGEIMNERTREWRKRNPAAYRASKAARRAAELRATPPWASHELIAKVYEAAAELEQSTGVKHHVDHEIPLRHPLVCGLHAHFNLRPMTAIDNMKKSNEFLVS